MAPVSRGSPKQRIYMRLNSCARWPMDKTDHNVSEKRKKEVINGKMRNGYALTRGLWPQLGSKHMAQPVKWRSRKKK